MRYSQAGSARATEEAKGPMRMSANLLTASVDGVIVGKKYAVEKHNQREASCRY